jgi:hypothetical protein
MSCPAAEQLKIQREVARMSVAEMAAEYEHARATALGICVQGTTRMLNDGHLRIAHSAIEYMVRIECRENGGGWFYRMRRRPALMRAALQSAKQHAEHVASLQLT